MIRVWCLGASGRAAGMQQGRMFCLLCHATPAFGIRRLSTCHTDRWRLCGVLGNVAAHPLALDSESSGLVNTPR